MYKLYIFQQGGDGRGVVVDVVVTHCGEGVPLRGFIVALLPVPFGLASEMVRHPASGVITTVSVRRTNWRLCVPVSVPNVRLKPISTP